MLWRQRLVTVLFAAAGLVLAGRLIQIQWLDQPRFAARAERQRMFEETTAARPGDIFDRHGRLLATTTQANSLFVDPSLLENPLDVAHQLAEPLGLNADDLMARLEQSRERRFLWIKRRLNDTEADAVRALPLPESAWGFRPEYVRHYPQGSLAAHVLGLRDIDGRGRGGVEEWFDATLRGTNGHRRLVRDARGYVLDVLDEAAEPAVPGAAITLTLDSVLQLFVERELDGLMEEWQPTSACAIVIEPRTGDVLALASRPGFDPNRTAQVAENAWVNTAIASTFEPGSTFKPGIVAWGLDQGLIRADEEFDCERGAYRMGSRILHDHHPYGRLDIAGILVKSSNIGMAKIGERLGNAGLHEAATRFGFGRKTGIELPGELPGLLRPLDAWTSFSTGSVPMGQEVSATPLQVLESLATLANGGRAITPHLLLATAGRRAARNVIATQVVSESTAAWLVQTALVGVVERGTGQKARIDGVSVFGKSGTAQKIDPATGQYSETRYVSSFACGAPAENPRAVVLVSVNEPGAGRSYYGGTVAAPAAAAILTRTLAHLDATESMTSAPTDADRR
ncbi:MAG: penicillin-binding protein 2 [Planctomycetaceae bacterium]